MRSGNLIVRLVNDRGLASLEIASAGQPSDFWDLELVATLSNLRRQEVSAG